MNPFRIYRDEWANALRLQTTATEYTSFIAMPFDERFSYRSQDILSKVIGRAMEEANSREDLPRRFSVPDRLDRPRGAVVITEEIVLQAESHLRWGPHISESRGRAGDGRGDGDEAQPPDHTYHSG